MSIAYSETRKMLKGNKSLQPVADNSGRVRWMGSGQINTRIRVAKSFARMAQEKPIPQIGKAKEKTGILARMKNKLMAAASRVKSFFSRKV
jgi:hypothetical protein